MIDVDNDLIFVAIAAYREPELRQTIENCIERAAQPDRLRFGVCLQYDLDGPPETQPDCLDGLDANVRVLAHDWTESKGGCWARHRTQGLYDGEGFTLQIDSHMRMAHGWDQTLIAMMHDLPSDRPLITGQCPLYSIDDGLDIYHDGTEVPVTVIRTITPAGWLWHPAELRPDVPPRNRPTRVLSGMLVFTLGQWNIDVRQDPEHLYTGEELALTVRSFTHGYDLFNPSEIVAWHRHHPDGNRKFIHDGDDAEVSVRGQRAYRRLRTLHAGDPDRILLPYSTGWMRSVDEYHRWAGVDFDAQTITDAAIDGETPELLGATSSTG